MGRGPIESLRALGADADKDINLSVNVRWGLDGCLLDKLALARGQVPLYNKCGCVKWIFNKSSYICWQGDETSTLYIEKYSVC